MNFSLAFVALGLAAGMLSGLIGLGGGVLIVPALVLLFGFSQHKAEGTTLALHSSHWNSRGGPVF